MYNYTLEKEQKSFFILSYEIKNNKIILKLANGEKYPVPYTLENEMKVLEKMKEQVRQSESFLYEQENIYKRSRNLFVFTLISASLLLGCGILANNISLIVFSSLYFMTTPFSILFAKKAKKNIDDIHKNKLFLENEVKLNEKMKTENNVLYNTNKKTKETINQIHAKQEEISINTIDQISLSELNKIMSNIEKNEKLGLEYSKPGYQKCITYNKQ